MTGWRDLSRFGARQAPSAQEMLARNSVFEEINGEIEALEERLEDIRQKKATYMSYTAPFRCLPTEILNEITTIYLEDGGNIMTITQVCSRLREVVFGMTMLWRRVTLVPEDTPWGPVYQYTKERGVQCATTEQLNIVLGRVRSAALDLIVEMPAEQGTLELISTRKCPIRSLEVSDAVGMGCEPHRFEELNVTSLEVLSLDYVGNENIKGFMDLALRSAQQQITLKWMAHALNLSQFHHELIPRVVDLQLSVDGLDLEGISELAPIPLPNVQTCQFHNHHGLLKVFNLSNAEKLDIQYWVDAPDFTINSLPTHLTEMLLGHLTFTTAMISTAGPHFMPYLKTLIIDTITCQGPLKRYFHVPKLKHFQIKRVFFSFDYNNPDEEEEIRVDSAQLLCDDSFFRGIPELELLSLRGMTINGEFVAGLRACLLLERLTLVDCSIEEFIPSFLARVADIKTFPALRFLDLSYSWPKKSDTSYKHFVARCTVERPQLRVNASHRPEEYLSEEISSLESASDSDYDDYF